MAGCNKGLLRSKQLELDNTFSKTGDNLKIIEIQNKKYNVVGLNVAHVIYIGSTN